MLVVTQKNHNYCDIGTMGERLAEQLISGDLDL